MIPLRLRLRNFMCYRDNVPPLDLTGVHLACLTGANGHGKSALLDAMTWALWGRARAKRDDELIHLGQAEMEVEFTFALGETVYRVLRKRDSTQRGRTLLDLQVEHDGEFRSLNEPTVRGTQEAIIRLLRMDYETFTNSSFLLQGKADAFTTRTPAERKQVLGEILGLSRFDEYEERAKEKARERDRRLVQLEGMLRDIDRELAREDGFRAELDAAEARVAELSAAVREAEVTLHELRTEQQGLEHQQVLLRDVDRRAAQAERELAEAEAQGRERQGRIAAYEAVLAERQQVEQGYAALQAARQVDAGWGERLARHAQLQGRQRDLERAVDEARRELDLAQGRLGERLKELERRASVRGGMEHDLEEVRGRLAHLAECQAERDAAQQQVQVLAEEAAGLKVRNDHLRAEIDALKDKRDLLEREAGQARCPLCGQALPEAERERLLADLNAEGKALSDAHRANTARRQEIAAESARLEAEGKRLDRELAAQQATQRREAQLEQSLVEAGQAAEEAGQVRSELEAVRERLMGRDYAPAEQAELARLAEEVAAVAYDAAEHERARQEVAALAAFETAFQRLGAALERIDEERVTLAGLRERQARWQESLAGDRARRQALLAEVARLPEVAARAQAAAGSVDELQGQSSRARLELGAARQKVDHCRYLAVERERYLADRQRAAEEKAAYEELRLAFGKKGIQAMIIEAAIPEIEFQANELLARMTDSRMHARFETQRETLKGDVVETLDIQIADELGTRPYELFSGGEAFRVNFAIRIALSKLLAHRAGAQLQLLVVDEGFGTQDAAGRERLVEAIHSIQDDFARILVITHIEELKDAFPVRIDVTKTEEGSLFRIQ